MAILLNPPRIRQKRNATEPESLETGQWPEKKAPEKSETVTKAEKSGSQNISKTPELPSGEKLVDITTPDEKTFVKSPGYLFALGLLPDLLGPVKHVSPRVKKASDGKSVKVSARGHRKLTPAGLKVYKAELKRLGKTHTLGRYQDFAAGRKINPYIPLSLVNAADAQKGQAITVSGANPPILVIRNMAEKGCRPFRDTKYKGATAMMPGKKFLERAYDGYEISDPRVGIVAGKRLVRYQEQKAKLLSTPQGRKYYEKHGGRDIYRKFIETGNVYGNPVSSNPKGESMKKTETSRKTRKALRALLGHKVTGKMPKLSEAQKATLRKAYNAELDRLGKTHSLKRYRQFINGEKMNPYIPLALANAERYGESLGRQTPIVLGDVFKAIKDKPEYADLLAGFDSSNLTEEALKRKLSKSQMAKLQSTLRTLQEKSKEKASLNKDALQKLAKGENIGAGIKFFDETLDPVDVAKARLELLQTFADAGEFKALSKEERQRLRDLALIKYVDKNPGGRYRKAKSKKSQRRAKAARMASLRKLLGTAKNNPYIPLWAVSNPAGNFSLIPSLTDSETFTVRGGASVGLGLVLSSKFVPSTVKWLSDITMVNIPEMFNEYSDMVFLEKTSDESQKSFAIWQYMLPKVVASATTDLAAGWVSAKALSAVQDKVRQSTLRKYAVRADFEQRRAVGTEAMSESEQKADSALKMSEFLSAENLQRGFLLSAALKLVTNLRRMSQVSAIPNGQNAYYAARQLNTLEPNAKPVVTTGKTGGMSGFLTSRDVASAALANQRLNDWVSVNKKGQLQDWLKINNRGQLRDYIKVQNNNSRPGGLRVPVPARGKMTPQGYMMVL